MTLPPVGCRPLPATTQLDAIQDDPTKSFFAAAGVGVILAAIRPDYESSSTKKGATTTKTGGATTATSAAQVAKTPTPTASAGTAKADADAAAKRAAEQSANIAAVEEMAAAKKAEEEAAAAAKKVEEEAAAAVPAAGAAADMSTEEAYAELQKLKNERVNSLGQNALQEEFLGKVRAVPHSLPPRVEHI